MLEHCVFFALPVVAGRHGPVLYEGTSTGFHAGQDAETVSREIDVPCGRDRAGTLSSGQATLHRRAGDMTALDEERGVITLVK